MKGRRRVEKAETWREAEKTANCWADIVCFDLGYNSSPPFLPSKNHNLIFNPQPTKKIFSFPYYSLLFYSVQSHRIPVTISLLQQFSLPPFFFLPFCVLNVTNQTASPAMLWLIRAAHQSNILRQLYVSKSWMVFIDWVIWGGSGGQRRWVE